MNDLFEQMSAHVSLTEEDIAAFNSALTVDEFEKRTCFFRAGEVGHHVYFLSRGVVKGYRIEDGIEVIEHLFGDQRFFTAFDSFLMAVPSKLFFETVTDCVVYKLYRDDFERILTSDVKWEKFLQERMSSDVLYNQDRIRDFQLLTATERYVKFVEEWPQLAQHVSIENLASYLGMNPQSLSRIRGNIKN